MTIISPKNDSINENDTQIALYKGGIIVATSDSEIKVKDKAQI